MPQSFSMTVRSPIRYLLCRHGDIDSPVRQGDVTALLPYSLEPELVAKDLDELLPFGESFFKSGYGFYSLLL